MKRYKDCALICNNEQSPIELLDNVLLYSKKKGYKTDRYKTFEENDSLSVYIKVKDLPYSRMIICAFNEGDKVEIVNIIPMPESGISHIDYIEYNKLLDIFRDNVFTVISERHGNKIEENTEDYTLEEIIPLSYPKLQTWLSMYPLSGHTLDTKRWYDFIIELHKNREQLPISDFEKHIQENYEWDEKTIEEFSFRLESQLELLDYYDEHR